MLGASRTLEVAKEFQKIVAREYALETQIVRAENESWYFIYSQTFDDKKVADTEKEKALSLDTKGVFVGNPWLYIVK